MNNAQLAHKWAAQTKQSGRGSNFYFDGPTIYSWGGHFPVASFTDATVRGMRVVLFTSRSYSMSTSRHKGLARSALQGLDVVVIECPEVLAGQYSSLHSENLEHFKTEFENATLKASRARSYADAYIRDAAIAQHNAATYAEAFALEIPQWSQDAISPELLARANAAAAERKAKEERDRARRAEEYAQKIAAWRNGASANECELWRFAGEDTALRVSRDGKHVETSRGATITMRTAHELYRRALSMIGRDDAEREKAARLCPHVDGFAMREFCADGSIVVGCHTLKWPEIARFANARNW